MREVNMESTTLKLIAKDRSISSLITLVILAGFMISCGSRSASFDVQVAKSRLDDLAVKATKLYLTVEDTTHLPRTLESDGSLHLVPAQDWTSGFFPGYLWYVYEYTHDEKFLRYADRETKLLENEQFNTRNHDVGFIMYCSYGNALRLSGNEAYKSVLVQSAHSLTTRFNPIVGSIKSWPSMERWDYPVIVDNMMNLELLFWAAKATGDQTFYEIATTHANTTLKNHFREDNSSFHVIGYDTLSGEVTARNTYQGLADSSTWARGQAWGLYGFTMAYRETKDSAYLRQAEKIAEFIIGHKNLPADKVPYWDFDAPAASSTLRDASAGAIIASALLELSQFSDEGKSKKYLEFAESLLATLSSSAYFSGVDENGGFALKHCVGNKPKNKEVDVPLNYADYYYTEALIRYIEHYREQR